MNLSHTIRVIHLNYFSKIGGAFHSMNRLHQFLEGDLKFKSLLLTSDIYKNKWHHNVWRLFKKLERILLIFLGYNRSAAFSCYFLKDKRVLDELKHSDFDVLHLHWVGNGMLPFEELHRIGKPIFITLHDFYLITGGCHILGNCQEYKSGCNKCPLFSRHSSLPHKKLKSKVNSFKNLDVTFICPSNWVLNVLKESFLYKEIQPKSVVIPNMLDKSYFVTNKNVFNLGIKCKPIVCFGAVGASYDFNKGFFRILSLLEELSKTTDFELHVFGDLGLSVLLERTTINFKDHGYLSSFNDIQKVYASADVTIVPSYQETFGQVALESIAVGTPVVSFKGTGLDDIIINGVNGFVCDEMVENSFTSAIMNCLFNDFPPKKMLESIAKFSSTSVGESFTSAYLNKNV
jgi:glycosyltransferase involved in cell wall biosynthesis